MRKKNVLFVKGVPDSRLIKLDHFIKNGDIEYRISGTSGIFRALDSKKINKATFTLDASPKQDTSLKNVHVIFNEITDADTHKITLAKLHNFVQKLPSKIPVFNKPADMFKTTRDNIYKLLHHIEKLHVPKTVRLQPTSPADIYTTIEEEGFSLPVIFRQAGDHGGVSTIKVNDDKENFYAFALDGREYYLTQYVDYEKNGIYSKYRLVIVDGEVFIRHVIFSDQWIIHSHSRNFMAENQSFKEKEAAVLKSFDKVIKPHIQPIITQVHNVVGLDYFGMDCSIDDHYNITVFEVNANMNVFADTSGDKQSIWSEKIDEIKNAIIKMIEKNKEF